MKVKISKYLLCIFCLLIYWVLILLLDFSTIQTGYHITALIPAIYIILYFTFLHDLLKQITSPFLIAYTFFSFFKYFVLSVTTILEGYYAGLSPYSPSDDSLTNAGIIIIVEMILSFLSIGIFYSRDKLYFFYIKQKFYSESSVIYFIFILFSILLFLAVPSLRNNISFGFFYEETTRSINLLSLGLQYVVINSKYILFFIVFSSVLKSKIITRYHIAILLLVALFVISFKTGLSRKPIIAAAVSCYFILIFAFPVYKRILAIPIILITLTLFLSVSLTRDLYTNTTNLFDNFFNIKYLQPYFCGQYNVAIAEEASLWYATLRNSNALTELLRPCFIIGSIIKDASVVYSLDIFSQRISLGSEVIRHDQILPFISQVKIIFGYPGVIIFPIFFIYLGNKCDKIFYSIRILEIKFLAVYSSFYLAQFIILNLTILINAISFELGILLPVVILNYYIYKYKHQFISR
jgi:hypothetical protein